MRRFSLPFLPLALATMACLSCHGPSGYDSGSAAGYRIAGFTLLGDSAVALRIETREGRNPPGSLPQAEFALLDRKQGTLRPLDSLPPSAGPTFPEWFFACDSGRPVSVHPRGYVGPAGACTTSHAPAISPDGYALAFADAQAKVNLLSRELEPVTYRATGADSAAPLEYASGYGRVFILEWHGRDSVLWRGFANDDPSGSDSAWLPSPPREIRVHGEGTKLVCTAPEENEGFPFCWSPPQVSGFRYAFAEAAGGPILPEWNPGTGELAWLEESGRFVFLDPQSGQRNELDAYPLLDAYRP
jgi:hypothetical protein